MSLGQEKRCNCKCQVCGKRFAYGDEQSPMLKNNVQNKIVKFYNLEEYEIEADRKFYKNYSKSHGFYDDEHLFICYECMEKALGRRIEFSDLINIGVPLNIAFEEMYFKNNKV